jgi:hypothetical protein
MAGSAGIGGRELGAGANIGPESFPGLQEKSRRKKLRKQA